MTNGGPLAKEGKASARRLVENLLAGDLQEEQPAMSKGVSEDVLSLPSLT